MFCPACGAECDDSARFCKACGKPLTSDQPPEAPAVPSAPGRSSAMLAVLVTVSLALVAVVIAGALLWPRDRPAVLEASSPGGMPASTTTAPDEGACPAEEREAAAGEDHEGGRGEHPELAPADDPIAEAQVVLENYLAADLGHDGVTMAKYLGGQAAARFNPDVQGQEDLTVHSKVVTGGTMRDQNTVDFTVRVEWSTSDSYEVQHEEQTYVVKRTEGGWKITSTPEYPE